MLDTIRPDRTLEPLMLTNVTTADVPFALSEEVTNKYTLHIPPGMVYINRPATITPPTRRHRPRWSATYRYRGS